MLDTNQNVQPELKVYTTSCHENSQHKQERYSYRYRRVRKFIEIGKPPF